MPIETASYISQLVPANPPGGDSRSTADDHLRLIKQVLQTQFPNLGAAAVNATAALLNSLGVTQATSDNSTNTATTAFVQAVVASISPTTGIPVYSGVSGTSVTATAGQHLGLNNVAATAVTLPASPSAGQMVWITPKNGLKTNTVLRNGNKIMAIADDITLTNPNATYCFRYLDATDGWRF